MGMEFYFNDFNYRTGRLTVSELEAEIINSDLRLYFENLMGGGPVGSAANMVINIMGQFIFDSEKHKILSYIKTSFKRIIKEFL